MSSVAAYYNGKSVLVTGATGFMGKVLLEKLLRSSPDVKAIYILVRHKSGQSTESRVADLVKCKVFDRVRAEWPNFHEKIKPISAELTQPNLAITAEDAEELQSEVNIIFHCAATIRFDEPLKYALLLNAKGTKQLLALAHKIKKLEAFIHISTAYANCNQKYIEEIVYPVPVDPDKLFDLAEWMDEPLLDQITPKLIQDWPNTYTFTKALTEYLIQKEKGNLNVAIIRPSIVGASWQEPFPGWIDNFNGISGLLIAAGKGIIRSVKCNTNAVADLIPVDIAINLTLAAGWHTAVHRPKSILIYQSTTGGLNPISWGEIENFAMLSLTKNPFNKTFRTLKPAMTSNDLLHAFWKPVCHKFPAFVYDLYMRLTGRKPRMVKILNRLEKSISFFDYFTSRTWEWTSDNISMLMNELSPKDKQLFFFDVREVHWSEYMDNYCAGMKKYLLNEDMSGIAAARRHMRMLKTIGYVIKTSLLVIIWQLFISRSQMAQNIWHFVVNLCYKFLDYFITSSTLRH